MRCSPSLSLRQIIGDKPLFVTRWWGFRADKWAAVTFPFEKTVDRWLSECPDGGYVLGFASHHEKELLDNKNDQGRVFGVYEFVPQKVAYPYDGIIDPAYIKEPRFIKSDNEFRWPFGLRAVRAWEFDNRVMTGGTLPSARSLAYEATTNMVRITGADFTIANQHLLHEVPVYGRDFAPLVLKAPNQLPDQNYLLTCEDQAILRRMPHWQPGEILFKPGIASNFEDRRDFLNNHALAKIFGLSLQLKWQEQAASTDEAVARETAMIDGALKIGCRIAAVGQREFLFGREKLWTQIIMFRRPHN